ncbi:MAG: class I SAM-dependent methyltransferase [Myxococcales bacterium]|nr:class I SAM-dependent methyltransferase [Myxococcales bacterium]
MKSHTIYDHPLYYDILFSWNRNPEADFYEAAFERYGVATGEPVLEMACGPGQVARRLAQRGWRLTGIDDQPAMIAFLREHAAAEGVSIDAICADMREFSSSKAFGAAYNPLSSFRLLHEASDVDRHLRAMAGVLRPTGIYILDLDFLGSEATEATTTDEEWEMARGSITVRATDAAVHVDDGGVRQTIAWGDGTRHLLGYTARAFAERVNDNGCFSIEAWHPEAGQGADGVSTFSPNATAELPAAGRTMVVLRRI